MNHIIARNIDMPFTSLKKQIDGLKLAADKCFVPSIYVHTYKIGELTNKIKLLNLTDSQKKVFNKLDEEALKQFERLTKGRCSCTISRDI